MKPSADHVSAPVLSKACTYAVMHLAVAVGVAYAITGNWVAAMAIGLLEPFVQVCAYIGHESAWERLRRRRRHGWLSRWELALKPVSYFHLHVAVASAIVYIVTRDAAAALAIGLTEPAVQVVAYHLHERAWRARQQAMLRSIEPRSMELT
jgi:uncharacterized membrane protein